MLRGASVLQIALAKSGLTSAPPLPQTAKSLIKSVSAMGSNPDLIISHGLR